MRKIVMTLVLAALAAACSVSPPSAAALRDDQDTTPAVTETRRLAIQDAVATDAHVKPYFDLALAAAKAEFPGATDLDDRTLHLQTISCADRPVEFGTPNKDFCGIALAKGYGWYADPMLVTKVRGYVRQVKITAGELGAEDLKIVEVTVVRPLPTGLE